MRIVPTLTDEAVIAEIGVRLVRARLDRDQSQEQLAAQAGVSKRTLERMERGEAVKVTWLVRVLRALELTDTLDQLVPEPEPVPTAAELARLRRKRRQRASGRPRTTPLQQPGADTNSPAP